MAQEQQPDFATILRRARRAAGFSQEALAERAGLSARAISDLERGVNRAPRRDTLDMLADALALSTTDRNDWERLRRQQAMRATDIVPSRPSSRRRLPPGSTVTFLFTDIEGSAGLWEDAPEAMAEALRQHDNILRSALEAHGRVFKSAGDAFFAWFADPNTAVDAAVDAQRQLRHAVWEGIEPLRVRMALHSGVAVERDGDYFGQPVNRAARMLDAAHGGQVLLSEVTVGLVRDTLPDDVTLRDLGHRRFKDLLRPEPVFQLLAPDLPAEFPPLRTLDAHPNNLPIQPTRFFGRAEDVARLVRLLREDDARLVTLTGPGGSGKTRLAIEVAAALLDDFPDGVFFVDLAPLTDPDHVLPAIAGVLGIRLQDDQHVGTVLAAWLSGKRRLLVLDNLEQVLPAARDIGALAQAGETHVLATSRAPLRLRAEREYPVLPLPLPSADAADAGIASSEVVQLFIDRARAVRPGFDPSDEDLQTIVQICGRLDGLPLAIELAAASMRMFPPRAILSRLEQRLPLPASGARDVPSRQQTLHETIRWSYDLLAPAEQALLRRLSVFMGGWTLEAAETVVADELLPGGGIDAVSGLTTLVEHSLVQPTESRDGSPRFGMLETIRTFGLELVGALGEADNAHRRHADYLISVFTDSMENVDGSRRGAILRLGDAELENVRVALEWSITRDPDTALRLAHEFSWHWFSRGANREALRWLALALATAGDIPDELHAHVLGNMGMHATSCGQYELARARTDAALAIFQRLGDQIEIGRSLFGLGRIEMWAGDPSLAEALFDASAELHRSVDYALLPTTLMNLGSVRVGRGDLDGAVVALDEALVYAERFNDAGARSLILGSHSDIAMLRGDLPAARRLLGESVVLLRQQQDPRYIAQSLESAAWLAVVSGDVQHSVRFLGAAGRIREDIGVPIPPKIQQAYDRYVPIANARLDPDSWQQAWAQGRGLSLDGALEAILASLA